MGNNNATKKAEEDEVQQPSEQEVEVQVLIREAKEPKHIYCDNNGRLVFESLQQPQNFAWTRTCGEKFCLSREVKENQYFLSVGRRKLIGCRKVR